jgi:hypothetical protein
VQCLQAKRVLPPAFAHHVTVADDVIDDCVEARGKPHRGGVDRLRGRAARLCADSGEDGMDRERQRVKTPGPEQ